MSPSKKSSKKSSSPDLIFRELKRGELRPIYYLAGEDPYTIKDITSKIIEKLNPSFKQFNLLTLTGGEVDGLSILNQARQFPMMDNLKVVLVRQADKLSSSDWKALLPYLESPSPSTALIFIDEKPKPSFDSRTKAGKLLSKYAVICRKPYDNQLPNWLHHRAKVHNLSLQPDAAYLIVDRIGDDLVQLDNALQRISLYLGGEGEVSAALVQECLPEIREGDIFSLIDYIAGKKLHMALKFLRRRLDAGDSPINIIYLLARHFRLLLQAKELQLHRNLSPQSLQPLQNLPKFIRDKKFQEIRRQLQHFSRKELIYILLQLAHLENRLKTSSPLPHYLLLEELLFSIHFKRYSANLPFL